VTGLSEGWPNTGPAACRVRKGIGAEERERPSSSSGGSRLRGRGRGFLGNGGAMVVVVLPLPPGCGGGVLERREELFVVVLGVLAREVEESIRRTDGAR